MFSMALNILPRSNYSTRFQTQVPLSLYWARPSEKGRIFFWGGGEGGGFLERELIQNWIRDCNLFGRSIHVISHRVITNTEY